MEIRNPIHFDLIELYNLDDFYKYLSWRHGSEQGLALEIQFKRELDFRKEMHFAMIELFHTVDEPKKILATLARLRGEDLEALIQSDFSEYTIPMIEEELKIMLGEKHAEWEKADRTKEDRLKKMADYDNAMEGRLKPQERRDFDKKYGYESLTEEQWKKVVNEKYGQFKKEQRIWEQGVWLTDNDVQGSPEAYTKAVIKKAGILEKARADNQIYQELLKKRREALGADRKRIEKEIEEYEEKILVDPNDPEKMTLEELEQVKRVYSSNLEWRVRQKLEAFLKKKGKKFEKWQIDKAVSMGMKFNIVTLRMPTLLAYWYIEPKSGTEAMRSPPFEDLVRILNPESFFFRFQMGGKLGETTRALRHSAVLGERAKEAGIKKVFLTKLPEWNDPAWKKGLKPDELKIVEKNRDMLMRLEQHLGIPWSELLRAGVSHIGGLFDASGWRGEIGIWDEITKAYSEIGQDHREFALGFQMNLAGGEAALEAEAWAIREADERGLKGRKRERKIQDLKAQKAKELTKERKKEIMKKIIRREPLLLAQLIANDKAKIEDEFKGRVDWTRLETALQFAQMEMTTDKKTEVKINGNMVAVDFGSLDFFKKYCGQYLDLKPGENIKDYHDFVVALQEKAKKKQDELALYKFPITLSLTSIPWKDTKWMGLGRIAYDRRLARDVGASAGVRSALEKLWLNPSPQKWEDIYTALQELKDSTNAYSTLDQAEKAVKKETQQIIDFNENKGRIWMNWVPGAEKGYRNLDGIFSTLRKFGIKGANAERAKRALESFSLSVLFYGPNGYAWDENNINYFVNGERAQGFYTENPEYAQDILDWAKAGLNWRLMRVAGKIWLPALLMLIAMMWHEVEEDK